MKTTFSPAIRGVTDINNDYSEWLLKDELALRVLYVCAFRVWYHKHKSPAGLNYGEFSFSQVETDLFGLKDTQQGKLRRTMAKLIRLEYVSKTDRRIDNDGSTIYTWTGDKFMFPIKKTDTETDKEQTTNRQRIDTNNRNNIDNIDNTVVKNSSKEEKPNSSFKADLNISDEEYEERMRLERVKAFANY